MRIGAIYGVALKGDPKIFYVGQTVQKPKARWNEHLRGKTAVSDVLRMFGGAEAFDFCILETANAEDLNERERFWIEKLGTFYPGGLNHTRGGEGGGARSTQVKARISELSRAYWAEPANRERVGKFAKTWWADPANKKLLSGIHKTVWANPEYKAKMRASQTESAKRRAAEMTAEDHVALSRLAKKQWADPETRTRMGAAISAAHARRREAATKTSNSTSVL